MSVGVKKPQGLQMAAQMRREISDDGNITKPTEFVLPTSEKNAGQPGTMMYEIQQLKDAAATDISYPYINTDFVTDNWSYVQVKNGQAIVNIDLKLNNIPAYQSVLIAQVHVYPYEAINVEAVSPGQTGGFLSVNSKGEVYFYTEHGLDTGIVRGQLAYFYQDNG